MKTTEEMIAVMQGYADGKQIEYRETYCISEWKLIDDPLWNWDYCEYRIKPEEKKERTYRPYKNIDEMIEDYYRTNCKDNRSTKGGMPLIWLHDPRNNITHLITAFSDKLVAIGSTPLDMRRLFEDYTYLDGSPVGKLVE